METGEPSRTQGSHGERRSSRGLAESLESIFSGIDLASTEQELLARIGQAVPAVSEIAGAEAAAVLERLGKSLRSRAENHGTKAILDSMADGFLRIDRDWRMVSLNAAARRILGTHTDPEQVLGRNYWELFPATLGGPIEAAFRTAATGTPTDCENFYEPWRRWFSVRAFPLEDGGISVFFRDVTDRKEAERAREQLAAIVEASSEAIMSTDLNGRLVSWNSAAERMFGWSAAEAIGRDISLIAPPETQEEQIASLTKLRQGQVLPRFEAVRWRKDGTRIDVSIKLDAVRTASGEIMSFAGVLSDVTEPRRTERRRNEQARLLDLSNDAIIVSTVEDRILYWNRGAEAMYGWSSAEAVGEIKGRLLQTQYPEPLPEVMRSLAEANRWEGELVQTARDGHKLTVYSRWALDRNEHGAPVAILKTNNDISAWKEVLQTVRRSEERLRLITDHSPSLVSYIGNDLRYRFTNARYADWFGERELAGQHAREVLGADIFEHRKPEMEAVLRGERRYFEGPTRHRRLGVRQCEISYIPDVTEDGVAGFYAFIADIHDRKEAERALTRSEARFRQLANAMPQLVWSATPDGKVDYYNDRAHDYDRIVHDGDRYEWKAVLHPDDEPATGAAWEHATTAKELYQFEHRLRRKNGEYRWHLSRGVPVFDEAGNIVKWFGTATDIHELKEAQFALEEVRATLEQAVAQRTAKLRESIGELEAFSYSVSHDMRAPLRAMQGFSQALLEEYAEKLDEQGRDLLQRIEKGARRLDLLVQDVLAYSRVAKGDFKLHPVSLTQLLEDVIQNFNFNRADIAIEGPLPAVMGHEALLSQIFSNLIGNAVKFARKEAGPRIAISARTDGKSVEIAISDNGIGIDPAHFTRIFEIFGRVYSESSYPGTGIGLAIVKKAVERLGGEIRVESRLGEGARFRFTLQDAAASG